MSEAGQDWAQRGAVAAEDAALASFAAGGALLLWDATTGRPGFANAAGHALFGGQATETELPKQARQRLDALAGGLASPAGIRLERLRLTSGFTAQPVTCGCKLLPGPGGKAILAIAVSAAELRRLGIAIPRESDAPRPVAAQEIVPPQADATVRPAVIRFLWQSDSEGRLTSLSDQIAALSGAGAAAALIGRHWRDLLGSTFLDRDGGLLERFATAATWSGHVLLWRTDSPGEGARVELSGMPVRDARRALSGFRGFGIARLSEREPFPLEPTPAAQPAAAPPPAVEAAGDAPSAAAIEAMSEAEAPPEQPDDATPPLLPEEALPATPRVEAHATRQEVEPDAAAEPGKGEAEANPPAQQQQDALPATTPAARSGNIVQLRDTPAPTTLRPVLEPSKPHLSSAERNAFREIAKALGARLAGDDEPGAPRLPPAAPLQVRDDEEAPVAAKAVTEAGSASARQRNSHADVLDRLPVAVLVNRGEEALYANRTLLDLLDYADLADLRAGGNVSRLIKEATRAEGGAMTLLDRTGHLVGVDAVLSSVSWQDEPATLMAFRHPNGGGGEVPVLTPEEAEEAELAAEFAAEEAESAARVEALRLDAEVRDDRIAELTAMLDTATDGVVTIDDRGRILSLNKAAEALFGYDQREVTGELFTLLFAGESHAPALDYLEGLKGGGVASVLNDGREVVGRVRQGGKIPLFMTMGQIAHGAEPRFCAVLRDITAWKKTEGELVDARKAAEMASAQKSDVLAKISHEIRTPLNAIIGFAEVMAEERFGPIANERYKEYLRDIHQSGGYVISLVNDLLDLAKIEAGKLDLDFASVNLNEIALSTVALLQPEAQRGRVVLRSGLSPKLPPVVADERSIKQIAINLLSNAVKFTDAGGQVIISTALGDQGEAILRVRDTGIGMDDDELKLALEPFRQVPTTRRAGGTGLGLPLTKALVEANRAAMSITSVKKEGTLVEITFPPQRVLAS
ncbi:Cell-division control histidine kinase PdhS [Hyphomicrobiales bacterium]|nr:Cell-division control histidine kinase PdhS [Hyphomicrobiales bacterium]CAH1700908.1 Cell-division control histidine kinase PdhS [Hyphomicrobiales bacterium]CAI0344783.1 Cell-division control histidine kinase PdhS [Hyphomicrobiales bacterium]